MDYSTYVWMAQLFIVGMSVGYMKDQIRYIRDQDDEQIHYLNGQLGDIADINDSNVRMKHTFERQIVNQKDSLGKIYEITSQLDQRGPEEVLFYAVQVLSKLMETQDAAIYTVARSLGIAIPRSMICGGGSKSPLWRQMIADILGIPLDIPVTEQGPGYGGAMLAMVACGVFESVQQAAEKLIHVKDTVQPDPERMALYEKRYQQFRQIYPACRELFKVLER